MTDDSVKRAGDTEAGGVIKAPHGQERFGPPGDCVCFDDVAGRRLYPATNIYHDLGTGSYRWRDIYTQFCSLMAGTGTQRYFAGGAIHIDMTAVGNNGAAVTDLMTFSLPANTLVSDGDSLEIIAGGNFGSGIIAKQLILYFGATAIYSTPALGGMASVDWQMRASIAKTGTGAQYAIASYIVDEGEALPTGSEESTPAENQAGAITIKCTGQYGAAVDDEIVQSYFKILFHPAPP